jgi:uncharacterized membrane protein YqjE
MNVPGIDDGTDDGRRIDDGRHRMSGEAKTVALIALVAVIFLVRLLWATDPAFRGLILTVAACVIGLAVVARVAWAVAMGGNRQDSPVDEHGWDRT